MTFTVSGMVGHDFVATVGSGPQWLLVSWESVCKMPLPLAKQEELLASVVRGEQLALACNPYTASDVALRLAKHPDVCVRSELARHTKHQEVFEVLLHDRDAVYVVAECAPFPEVFDVLIETADEDVLACLAGNVHLDAERLQRLSCSSSDFVYYCLGRNPTCEVSLDAAWGARFLLHLYPDLFAALSANLPCDEVRSLAGSWEGSMADLVEAVGLVSR